MQTRPLEVATATVDLTPPPGLPLGGYLLREGETAIGAHDPLQGSLVWLRDREGGEVLWCAIDALAVDEELARDIAAALSDASGCSTDAVLVCASHTHSSAAGWVRSPGPMLPDTADPQLRTSLVEVLSRTGKDLPTRWRACRPLLAEGRAPNAGGNRNDPAGPHDPSVGVLALVDDAGQVAATIVDFASHATVLGHDNLAWSADWPGGLSRGLGGALAGARPFDGGGSGAAQAAGQRPTIAFLQGAAGDASPRFVRRAQSFSEVDRLGGLVAGAAIEAILQEQPNGRPLRVAVRRASVTVPTRQLPDLATARRRAAELESAWQAAQAARVPAPQERIARTRYEGSLMLVALAEAGLPRAVEAPLAVVAVGDAAWIHLPVELFASFGLAIRERSPWAWTRVIGYTNGYLGYVADEAAHRSGVYEAFASQFDPEGGELLTEAALELLRSLAAELRVQRDRAVGALSA